MQLQNERAGVTIKVSAGRRAEDAGARLSRNSIRLESESNMETKEIGRQIMNELMGAGYVGGKDKKRNAFNSVLNDYSEEVCFGRVWAREGIDRKQRSILNVAMLTALNRPASCATTSKARSTTAARSTSCARSCCTRPCIAACRRRAMPFASQRKY